LLASCTTDATGRDVVLLRFFQQHADFSSHHPDPKHLSRAQPNLGGWGIAHLRDRAVRLRCPPASQAHIDRAGIGARFRKTLLFDEPATRWTSARNSASRHDAQARAIRPRILASDASCFRIISEIERVILLREDASSLMDENLPF